MLDRRRAPAGAGRRRQPARRAGARGARAPARPRLGGGAAPPPDEGRFRLWRAISALLQSGRASSSRWRWCSTISTRRIGRRWRCCISWPAQLRPMRVVLLGTYRDVEARMDAETSELLSRIGREGSTLRLARLDRGAAARFVRGRAGDVERRRRGADPRQRPGQPALSQRDDEPARRAGLGLDRGRRGAARGPGGHPTAARSAGRRRRARCWIWRRSRATSSICRCWSAASDRDAAWVSARLAEAARRGSARGGQRRGRAGARRRFAHALFREVLYRELADESRRALHGRLAEALERASGTVSPARGDRAPRARRSGRACCRARWTTRCTRPTARRSSWPTTRRSALSSARATRSPRPATRRRCCARVLLATGEARIRRGEVEAGKADCREAATIARARDDAELAARAALTYGRVFTFGLVDPVLVDMIETSLAALPPGDSALARAPAGPPRRRAAAEPQGRGAGAGGARGDRDRAAPRRQGDAARDLARRDLGADGHRPGGRAARLEPRGRAAGDGAGGSRRACSARTAAWRWRTSRSARVEAADARIAAFETLASELKAPWMGWRGAMLRAVRATMEGRFDEAERLAAEARRMGKAAGDPVVDTVWTTNREGLLRAAERHDELAAFEPDVCRVARRASPGAVLAIAAIDHHPRPARAARIRCAFRWISCRRDRCRRSTTCSRRCLPPRPRRWSGRASSPEEILPIAFEGCPGECSVLGMSYMSWEGPWARLLGLLAAYLGRWEAAWAHFEEARTLLSPPAGAALSRADGVRVRAGVARARRARRGRRSRRSTTRPRAAGLGARAGRGAGDAGVGAAHRRATGRLSARRRTPRQTGASERTTRPGTPAPGAPTPGRRRRRGAAVLVHARGRVLDGSLRGDHLPAQGQPGAPVSRPPVRRSRTRDSRSRSGGRARGRRRRTRRSTPGDAGELLDEEARRSYKDRLDDLRETLAEAESFGDGARAERARAEMELLTAELGRAVGLGGRVRRAGGAAERARSAVQRRIKNALERIGEHAPALAAYLGRTVKTGNACVFRPAPV